jgi:hypothetical protein
LLLTQLENAELSFAAVRVYLALSGELGCRYHRAEGVVRKPEACQESQLRALTHR